MVSTGAKHPMTLGMAFQRQALWNPLNTVSAQVGGTKFLTPYLPPTPQSCNTGTNTFT
jgi:hypothetical protein